ncbi:MAG: RHS repeat-associated core domain-containing protein, partial [Candidatus Schekmanbacteria bacterium]|nr:RHS repeat-associated core domain-containing protein [Candidatus Schekmanbacteria bacterium]
THPNQPPETYDYDAVGNRWPSVNVYDAANRLLEDAQFTYTYNRNGSLTSKTEKATSEVMKFYWTPENQLIKIEKYHTSETTPYTIATYIYDGFGRRVAKNVNGVITKYLYDKADILLETDNNDNVVARYTHGPGIDEPLIMQRGGQSYYFVTDGLGSVVKLVNSNGTVINNYAYDSFGNIVSKTESVPNSYTYTAREFDPESGLYYYRTRYYDARIGRFISEDKNPGNIWEPISFNKFIYTYNNPVNWIDPYGFEPECSGSNTGNNTDNDTEQNDEYKPYLKPEAPKPDTEQKEKGWVDTAAKILGNKEVCWGNVCITVDVSINENEFHTEAETRAGTDIKIKW